MSYNYSDLIKYISTKMNDNGVEFFIVGATARDILCQDQGIDEPQRKTNDVDFAIFLESWNQFRKLESDLSSDPNINKLNTVKFTYLGQVFDIVAFGGIEDDEGDITMPPQYEIVMNMTGFVEAYESAKEVDINGSSVKVVTPEMLAILKIISWNDSKTRTKDLEDLNFILNHIDALFPEFSEDIYDNHEDILDHFNFDTALTTIAYLGRKAASYLKPESLKQVNDILDQNKDRLSSYFSLNSLALLDQYKEEDMFEAFLFGLNNPKS